MPNHPPVVVRVYSAQENTTTSVTLHCGHALLVGRMPSNDRSPAPNVDSDGSVATHHVVVPSQYASENHLCIYYQPNGRITVCDLGSTNGTLAPLPKGAERSVEPGTRLKIPGAADILIEALGGSGSPALSIDEVKTPSELLSLVRRTLGQRASLVELRRDSDTASHQADYSERFPLWKTGYSLRVTWSIHETRSTYEDRWLLDCIALFNARSDGTATGLLSEKPWRFVGRSPARAEVLRVIKKVADSQVPILLSGNTGVGKTLLARCIHDHSGAARGPFCVVHVNNLPETLLEGELFGWEKGGHSTASTRHVGMLVQASGGTLFLDEADKLSLTAQQKLLDVLDRGVVRPLGGSSDIPVRFRLITATCKNLKQLCERGEFSKELYYRLACACITVPDPGEEDFRELVPRLLDELRQEKNGFSREGLSPLDPHEIEVLTHFVIKQQRRGGVRELDRTLRLYLTFRQADESVEEAWRSALQYGPSAGQASGPERLPLLTVEADDSDEPGPGEAWTPRGKDQLRHSLHLLGDLMFLQEVRRAIRHPERGRSTLTTIATALGFSKTAVSLRLTKKYQWDSLQVDLVEREIESVRQQLMPYADRLITATKLLQP